MITRNDLKMREYSGKECTAFRISFSDEDTEMNARCEYRRLESNMKLWKFDAIVECGTYESKLYSFQYEVPSSTLSLELVAAAGLMRFNDIICNEIAAKQVLSSMLFRAFSGM